MRIFRATFSFFLGDARAKIQGPQDILGFQSMTSREWCGGLGSTPGLRSVSPLLFPTLPATELSCFPETHVLTKCSQVRLRPSPGPL